ncbi:hypothetical protein DRQ36_06425 [bacterium]|nr:MAG: hypothetical protein DRQ36_06425 [bacterium]
MNLDAPLVISGDTRYAYATGVVRGKWAKRLGKTEFLRLIDAETADIGKVLNELGFHNAAENPEKAIDTAWVEVIELVESLSHNPEVSGVLRLFTDFTNASLAVKAHLFEFDNEKYHLPGGNASAEQLARVASGETHITAVPKEVREAMRVAKALYSATGLHLIIDVATDSYFGTIFVDRLMESGREFLREFARRWADSKNLTSYLRIRIAGIPIEHFKRFFIEGGHIKRTEFRLFETLELDAIPARMVLSLYGKPLANAVTQLVRENDFEPLADYVASIQESFLRQNTYVSFGLEVLMAYAFLRWRELRAVGAILRMKKAGIDRERIIERVRYGDV